KIDQREGGVRMKTVLVHRPGGPEALDYTDAPIPAPGEREVLIRAKAFGVGQPDKLIRSGVYKWMPPLPANPGNDVAGEIEAIGVGTSLVQLAKLAGMKVIGTVSTREKAAYARTMGADEVIFYRDEDVVVRTRALTAGRGVSLVLDHVCGPEFYSYLGALDKWGTIVSYNAFAGLPT